MYNHFGVGDICALGELLYRKEAIHFVEQCNGFHLQASLKSFVVFFSSKLVETGKLSSIIFRLPK